MSEETLGCLELNSVAAGIVCADTMLKAANVELVSAQPVCAGKYFIAVHGRVADVKASVDAGTAAASDSYVDSLVIPRLDPKVIGALGSAAQVAVSSAVGIIETFSLASSILAADAAVKSAWVELIEIRLGRGLGGKSFVTLTGDVGAVAAAVDSAKGAYGDGGMIAKAVVIPSLHPDVLKSLY